MSKATKKAAKKIVKATKPTTETLTNPYRINGGYWACTAALHKAGLNAMHPLEKLVPLVIKAMGDNWAAFESKAARNEETHKDATQRVIQNFSVIARTKDYGLPLIEKCGLVAYFSGRTKQAGLFEVGNEPKIEAPAKKDEPKATSKPQAKAKAKKVVKAKKAAKKPQKAK